MREFQTPSAFVGVYDLHVTSYLPILFEDQIIVGTSSADTLAGLFGDDSIYGFSGNDHLSGNWGNDLIYGGWGHDNIFGGEGDDELWGDAGNDFIDVGNGDDEAYGGSGNDNIHATKGGVNELFGGSGNDTIIIIDDRDVGHGGGWQPNTAYGGIGDDYFALIGGGSNAFGAEGDDTFYFSSWGSDSWHYADGGSGTDDFIVGAVDQSLFIQIQGFEADETLTIQGDFFNGLADLDTNNNGVLDSSDAYVTHGGSFTSIQKDELYVLIWENGPIDADQIILA